MRLIKRIILLFIIIALPVAISFADGDGDKKKGKNGGGQKNEEPDKDPKPGEEKKGDEQEEPMFILYPFGFLIFQDEEAWKESLPQEEVDSLKQAIREVVFDTRNRVSKDPTVEDTLYGGAVIENGLCIYAQLPPIGPIIKEFLGDLQGDETDNNIVKMIADGIAKDIGVNNVHMEIKPVTVPRFPQILLGPARIGYPFVGEFVRITIQTDEPVELFDKSRSEIHKILTGETIELSEDNDPNFKLIAKKGFRFVLEAPIEDLLTYSESQATLKINRQQVTLEDLEFSSDGEITQEVKIGDLTLPAGTVPLAKRIKLPILDPHSFVFKWSIKEDGTPQMSIHSEGVTCDAPECQGHDHAEVEMDNGTVSGTIDPTIMMEAIARAFLENGAANEVVNGLFAKHLVPQIENYAKGQLDSAKDALVCLSTPSTNPAFDGLDLYLRPGEIEISDTGEVFLGVDLYIDSCKEEFIEQTAYSLIIQANGNFETIIKFLETDSGRNTISRAVAEDEVEHSRILMDQIINNQYLLPEDREKFRSGLSTELNNNGISDQELKDHLKELKDKYDLKAIKPFNVDILNLVFSAIADWNKWEGAWIEPGASHKDHIDIKIHLKTIKNFTFWPDSEIDVVLNAYMKVEGGRLIPVVKGYEEDGEVYPDISVEATNLPDGMVENKIIEEYLNPNLIRIRGENEFRLIGKKKNLSYSSLFSESSSLDQFLFDPWGRVGFNMGMGFLMRNYFSDQLEGFDGVIGWADKSISPTHLSIKGQYIFIGFGEEK